MRSDQLTKAQAQALKNKLQPMLGYLGRLKRRMRNRCFPPDDRLLLAVNQAEDAMHKLHVEAHYLSCPDSTGRLTSQHGDQAEDDGNQHHGDEQMTSRAPQRPC